MENDGICFYLVSSIHATMTGGVIYLKYEKTKLDNSKNKSGISFVENSALSRIDETVNHGLKCEGLKICIFCSLCFCKGSFSKCSVIHIFK